MNTKKKIFIVSMPIIMAICSLFLICDYVDAAPRTAVRSAPASRKSVSTVQKPSTKQTIKQQNTDFTESESESENSDIEFLEPENEEPVVENKSNQFETVLGEIMESAVEDNSFAEMIKRQRDALAASESETNLKTSQQNALKNGHNACDAGLRECMMKTCGNDFTKCATDGDTIFGDKLNKCRRDTECTGEEYKLFTAEIKADRDMNVKLSSYNAVLNCGNSYNACIMNECETTYTKCLGKAAADEAIQKCSVIAKDCTEYDSGLVSRFGNAIGKLRENAEKDVKKDEERLYKLRELMANQCTSLGAMFDERTFDCVYTVNFFAGDNQTTPMASRKRYAGETFVCTQEWFGINATTYKENAYRETRAQTAASSAMLGSGVGTAVGLVTSGAVSRSIDTQNAKKAVKEECEKDATKEYKNGKCQTKEEKTTNNKKNKENKSEKIKDGTDCTDTLNDNAVLSAQYKKSKCIIKECMAGYTPSADGTRCDLVKQDIKFTEEEITKSSTNNPKNWDATMRDASQFMQQQQEKENKIIQDAAEKAGVKLPKNTSKNLPISKQEKTTNSQQQSQKGGYTGSTKTITIPASDTSYSDEGETEPVESDFGYSFATANNINVPTTTTSTDNNIPQNNNINSAPNEQTKLDTTMRDASQFMQQQQEKENSKQPQQKKDSKLDTSLIASKALVSLSETDCRKITIHGQNTYNQEKIQDCDILVPKTFSVTFPYGIVYGSSGCTTDKAKCTCAVNFWVDTNDEEHTFEQDTKPFRLSSACSEECPLECATLIGQNQNARKTMLK